MFHIFHASVAQCVARRREPVYALGRVFVSRLYHSGQTHRFRRCSVAAAGAFKYPKTNSRNGNKVKLLLNTPGNTWFGLCCLINDTWSQ